MSPLADAIYQALSRRAKLRQPLITYSELVKLLPPLDPPHDNVTYTDKRLFVALWQVGEACRNHSLPTLSALVIRGAEKTPGRGYYQMFHPEAGDDSLNQQAAWEKELKKVKSTDYPTSLSHQTSALQSGKDEHPHRPRGIGMLRIAGDEQKPSTIFTGHVTCSSCAKTFDIEVQRNPNALTDKQPSFVILEMDGASKREPSGHLFIGSILTSPVLYYGSLKHCNHEQWISIFFNRALRDRSDHHFTILPSTSKGSPGETSA